MEYTPTCIKCGGRVTLECQGQELIRDYAGSVSYTQGFMVAVCLDCGRKEVIGNG